MWCTRLRTLRCIALLPWRSCIKVTSPCSLVGRDFLCRNRICNIEALAGTEEVVGPSQAQVFHLHRRLSTVSRETLGPSSLETHKLGLIDPLLAYRSEHATKLSVTKAFLAWAQT